MIRQEKIAEAMRTRIDFQQTSVLGVGVPIGSMFARLSKVAIISILMAIAFAGCQGESSKDLTRQSALEKLKKSGRFPLQFTVSLGSAVLVNNFETEPMLRSLSEGGLVTLKKVRIPYVMFDAYEVSLTPEGTKYLIPGSEVGQDLRPGKRIYRLIACVFNLHEVTGIRQNAEKTQAEVHYNVRVSHLSRFALVDSKNPCAEAMKTKGASADNQLKDLVAKMALYDDGWRVISIGSKILSTGEVVTLAHGDSQSQQRPSSQAAQAPSTTPTLGDQKLEDQKLKAIQKQVRELILHASSARTAITENAQNANSLDKAGVGLSIQPGGIISRSRISDSGTIVLEGSANVIGADVTVIVKPTWVKNAHTVYWDCGVSSPKMLKFVPKGCGKVLASEGQRNTSENDAEKTRAVQLALARTAPDLAKQNESLTMRGLGAIKLGMTASQASASAGRKLRRRFPQNKTTGCKYDEHVLEGSEDAYYIVALKNMKIAGICANSTQIQGPSGLRLHDRATKLRQLPSHALKRQDQSNHYELRAVDPTDRGYIIWFETQPGGLIRADPPLQQKIDHISTMCAAEPAVHRTYIQGGC